MNRNGSVARSHPKRRGGVLERALPGELILYLRDEDRIFLLNELGAAIWGLCDGNRSCRQIVELIAEQYDAPPRVILCDLGRLVAELKEIGLLSDRSP